MNSIEPSQLIPLEPVHQWLRINNIRTIVLMVVREVLNEVAMRDALDRLSETICEYSVLALRQERRPGVSGFESFSR
jgi:hypothetical protein